MNLSELYKLIKRFEGCRLKAYLCPAGVWTIGWGSTGPGIVKGVVWTLGLTVISAVIGVVVGVACAWARVHGATWLRWVVRSMLRAIIKAVLVLAGAVRSKRKHWQINQARQHCVQALKIAKIGTIRKTCISRVIISKC